MTKFMISFDEGAMDFPREELPAVADAAHAVMWEAKEAGAWVFGGGLAEHGEVNLVTAEGTVASVRTDKPYVGGFWIADVPSRAEALEWAAKTAAACRCAQEVREIMDDPEA